nr:MAG TPA: hypothetical protein [Caudoviricetes sp.]
MQLIKNELDSPRHRKNFSQKSRPGGTGVFD